MEQDPKNLIFKHFRGLKNKVDLRYDFLSGELKNSYDSTIRNIDEAENHCLIRNCENINPKIFESRLLELRQKLNQLNKNLNTFRIGEYNFFKSKLIFLVSILFYCFYRRV